MGLLIGGAMGVLGFAMAIFFGLAAANSMSEIVKRALVTSMALVVVGAAAGSVAAGVIRENARKLAGELAEAAEAAARARATAATASVESSGESEAAGRNVTGDEEAKVEDRALDD